MHISFPPTRAAALDRLAVLTPRLGRHYADARNTDAGPGQNPTTTALSVTATLEA